MDSAVARVQLYFPQPSKQTVFDAGSTAHTISFLRLKGLLRIGRRCLLHDGLFDTGAALTTMPFSVWSHFQDEIEWLDVPASPVPSVWWTTVSGSTGGKLNCRLGKIAVEMFDLSGNVLAPLPVVCKFIDNSGSLPLVILLGLSHGVLQGRRLHLDVDAREAWIEDR